MNSRSFNIKSVGHFLLFLFVIFFYEANAEVITVTGGKDTHTYGNDPNADYSKEKLVVGTPVSNCNPAMGRAYIKFDIVHLPVNVKQVLFGVTHRKHDWYCYSNCSADFYFYPVLETWEDNTLNYNNSPTEDNAVYGPIAISFPNDFGNREYDITELYQKWKSGKLANNGISIYSPHVGCNNASAQFMFFSSEDENLTKRPYLKVITEDSANTESKLLQTGQTKSYGADGNVVTDGSVKDDGYYQTGAARDYNRSTAGVVIDNVTELEWQDNVDSVQKKWRDSVSYPATEYCSTLSLDGHTDWRLPSIQELSTLVDSSQSNSSVTEGIFSHVISRNYWSSTTNTHDTSNAWIVYFWLGDSYYYYRDYDYYVRCVRSGQVEPSHFSRNNETSIVTDTVTALQWQDNDAAISTNGNWTTAIDYCENTLNLGGYTDWRLPNKNELLSIVDYSKAGPAIYSEFVNKISYYYWSSTTNVYYPTTAWIVKFSDGALTWREKTVENYVRCVRDDWTCPKDKYPKQGERKCILGTLEGNPGTYLPSCSGDRLIQGTDKCNASAVPVDPPGLFLPSCPEGVRLVQGTEICQ